MYSKIKNKNCLRDAKRGDVNKSIGIQVWGNLTITLEMLTAVFRKCLFGIWCKRSHKSI